MRRRRWQISDFLQRLNTISDSRTRLLQMFRRLLPSVCPGIDDEPLFIGWEISRFQREYVPLCNIANVDKPIRRWWNRTPLEDLVYGLIRTQLSDGGR